MCPTQRIVNTDFHVQSTPINIKNQQSPLPILSSDTALGEKHLNNDYPIDDKYRNPPPFPSFIEKLTVPCRRIKKRTCVYDPEENRIRRVDCILVRKTSKKSKIATKALNEDDDNEEMAYAIVKELRDAIYGRVVYAVGIRKRRRNVGEEMDDSSISTVSTCKSAGCKLRKKLLGKKDGEIHWEVVKGEKFAIKEMNQKLIRHDRGSPEDPIKEIEAMHFLRQWSENHGTCENEACAKDVMFDSGVMMSSEVLSDKKYLYLVMPFCEGGELFDVLHSRDDEKTHFTEEEARHCMHYLLKGIETLHSAGIAHRDISLENLIVENGKCIVIDLGQCLRVPFSDDKDSTTQEKSRRYLINDRNPCGKLPYMAPEISRRNGAFNGAFDGFSIDLWSAGVVLLTMVTGHTPWESTGYGDAWFTYVTREKEGEGNINLAKYLEGKDIRLSDDVIDLICCMLRLNPRDRLGLEQIWKHPWMEGKMVAPS